MGLGFGLGLGLGSVLGLGLGRARRAGGQVHSQPASQSGGPISLRAKMWQGRFARRRRLEGRSASHSLRRFSFCARAFLSCASGRLQNSPYLRVSCSAARQGGGVSRWCEGRRLSATITVRARRWRPPHGCTVQGCAVAWRRAVRVQSPVAALGVHWRTLLQRGVSRPSTC